MLVWLTTTALLLSCAAVNANTADFDLSTMDKTKLMALQLAVREKLAALDATPASTRRPLDEAPPLQLNFPNDWVGVDGNRFTGRSPTAARLRTFIESQLHDIKGTFDENITRHSDTGHLLDVNDFRITYFSKRVKLPNDTWTPEACDTLDMVAIGRAFHARYPGGHQTGPGQHHCFALVDRAVGPSTTKVWEMARPTYTATQPRPPFSTEPGFGMRAIEKALPPRGNWAYRIKQTYLSKYLRAIGQMKADVDSILRPMFPPGAPVGEKGERIQAPRVQEDPAMEYRTTYPWGGVRNSTVVLMALSPGHLPLLLNFLCSLRLNNLPMPRLMVIATSAALRDTLRSMGIASYHNDALMGILEASDIPADVPEHERHWFLRFPDSASAVLGDVVWTRSMFFKTAAVHLLLYAGYHVLFQDADVVWMKDPLIYIDESIKANPVDSLWMFDGNRSPRFEPFYANTGFFYLQSNDRAFAMWDRMMSLFELIVHWRSQQHVLCRILSELHGEGMVTVGVLPELLFPGGRVRAHPIGRKWALNAVINRENAPADWVMPYVVHMHYTNNWEEKVKFMKKWRIDFLQMENPVCSALTESAKGSGTGVPEGLVLEGEADPQEAEASNAHLSLDTFHSQCCAMPEPFSDEYLKELAASYGK